MKKVSSLVLSVGVGSALAWWVINSARRIPVTRKNRPIRWAPRREEEIYGI